MLRHQLLRIPLIRTWSTHRRFRVERELIKGRHRSRSSHRSIIHFSVNKAATQYVKSTLSRCAVENGMVPARIHDYAFHSDLPYLDQLSPQEMAHYQHIFKPFGYLYSVFGGMVEGIPNLNDYHTVLMIRDPRDVLTSLYFSSAYSHRPPTGRSKIEAFEKQRALAQRVGIDQYVIHESDQVHRVYHRYLDLVVKRPNVYVTTYENMISDFPVWLDSLLGYCDLKISSQLQQELLEEAHRSRLTKEDASKHMRQVTPGDHQRKLQPETVAHLNSLFSDTLEGFKYT